ncbi:uroporphyrinogen-III C-methyltransferase [Halanaerobacter jeridensis]|uniref:Siroheme synthase n=1 Tax=Halanaerobacter jeridensis TaxID=706427 RepID=A0A938XXJ8_9FIRM|nr:SAM-dependent methyltransferase [Halanaerobacter jeridensis]MBM7557145.1 siroheme synthase [Halanaerobacter jeridensis]
MPGKVYLVRCNDEGQGLMTVKGQEVVEQSDVIVSDHVTNNNLLEYAKDEAEVVQIEDYNQFRINQLLITKAQKGKTVTRLKNGDPFVFVREGNEAQQLAEKNIEFEIISGANSLPIESNSLKFYISLISLDLELAITLLLLFVLSTEFL